MAPTTQEQILSLQAACFENKLLADCQIHVGNRVFDACRIFLCLHSPVFRSYFHNQSIEQKTGEIRLDDLNPDVVESALRFMYSGQVTTKNYHDLYVSPIDTTSSFSGWVFLTMLSPCSSFQEVCLDKMIADISQSTVFKYLGLALSLDISELKKKCLEFYIDNGHYVRETSEWGSLVSAYPQLDHDFARAMLEKIQELRKENAELKSRSNAQPLYGAVSTSRKGFANL